MRMKYQIKAILKHLLKQLATDINLFGKHNSMVFSVIRLVKFRN